MRDAFGILCAVALALLLARLLCGCTLMPPPIDPHPPEPEPVPTVDPVDVDDCEMIDAILYELQCRDEGGLPLWQDPVGRPYADYCRQQLAKGVPWRTDCMVQIVTCEQLNPAAKGEWCGQ